MKTKAFTLIELSIALVIIGIIVGGVIVGQDLIKAAQLRSILKEYDSYKTAIQTFRLKYNCLPGDCKKATDFFGTAATCPMPYTATVASATCNGDNDGKICNNNTNYPEILLFWQHLSNAGLIAGQYTGARGPNNVAETVIGLNAPQSAYAKTVGWTGYVYFAPSGNTDQYPKTPTSDNILFVGTQYATNQTYGPAFLAIDAFNLDQKIDDGKPGTGNTFTFKPSPSPYNPYCTTTTNASTAAYDLSQTTSVCSMHFSAGF